MFSYASDIQSQCNLLQPEVLKSLNRKIQPTGMLLFRQYPKSFWPQDTNEQDAFVRLAIELYTVTSNYGELMVNKTLKGTPPLHRLMTISNLRNLFCHGLIVRNSNDINYKFSLSFFKYAGLACFPQDSADWKRALEYLVQYSNELADELDKALDNKLQNNLRDLQSEWIDLWLHGEKTCDEELYGKRVNSYNKSLIVKCYNDSNAKRGTRESHPPKTWVDLIKILSGSQTQCTRRDLDNLVSSISDNIYKSGETAVENPLEVQSEAIRSWAMKLTEPQEDD